MEALHLSLQPNTRLDAMQPELGSHAGSEIADAGGHWRLLATHTIKCDFEVLSLTYDAVMPHAMSSGHVSAGLSSMPA